LKQLSADPEQKRIGVALVQEGWGRAAGATGVWLGIVLGARLTGKVEREWVLLHVAGRRTRLAMCGAISMASIP
jgi:hypothetical protein